MTSFRSFEYGRDISLLQSALRSAERSLQQEDTNLNLFSSDQERCRISALTVLNKIQNAYRAEINSDIVSARLHAAVFANVLLSSDIVAVTELEYFESVLDDFPRIGWPFFMELVSSCGWRKYFLQCLKALPSRIRLTVLEAISDISKTTPYIWSCATSALIWSSCVEPAKEFTTSHDETHSALSKIEVLPLSNGASPTAECLLEFCAHSLICLSENCSLSDSEVANWASSLMNVVLDFVQSIFEPTEFSLFSPDLWVVNSGDLGKTAALDFYVVPLCCCRVVNNLSWPDICQLLNRAHSLLFKEVTKALAFCCGDRLIQEQKTKHALCSTHGFCVASLVYGSENELMLKTSTLEDLWHLIKRLQCLLNSVESINQECESRSPLIACLNDLVERWVIAEVRLPAEHEESLTSNAETFLRQVAPVSSEFIVWILSHENHLKHQWSCDKLNNHLNLLSHPKLFPCLCQVALCEAANDCVKKLVLQTCSAAPLKLQEAMLFYILHSESFSHLPMLKLTEFESRLTEKLNLICDADFGHSSESTEQVLSDFASLCMESPLEVIEGLVDLAVTDGCTTAVVQLLMHLRVACQYQKCPEVEQDVLGSFLLEAFENLLDTMTSKHHDNYVHLIEELVKCSNIVNCDWLLVRIVRYIELAGANDPHSEDYFPVRVFMAISPKMSKQYVAPMAQMLVQMLDKACLELNGARKEKVLHFLQAYIDMDDSWTTQGANLLCGIGLSCAAIKCLFKKKYPEREAFGAVTGHNCGEELVLLDAEQWRNECERIATQFPGFSLCDLLKPYFCLWLAGATSEEWVTLSAQLRTALSIDSGQNVSVVVFLQQLLTCLIGCKTYIAVGNWRYLFTCFANTVLDCLKATEDLSEEDLQDILIVLMFGLTSLPGQCSRQQLLLLVDVTLRMKTSALREELVIILQEALLMQYSEAGAMSNLVQTALLKLSAHHASQAEV